MMDPYLIAILCIIILLCYAIYQVYSMYRSFTYRGGTYDAFIDTFLPGLKDLLRR